MKEKSVFHTQYALKVITLIKHPFNERRKCATSSLTNVLIHEMRWQKMVAVIHIITITLICLLRFVC